MAERTTRDYNMPVVRDQPWQSQDSSTAFPIRDNFYLQIKIWQKIKKEIPQKQQLLQWNCVDYVTNCT